ncbi:hypothetical protein ES288_A09G213500v1 [Gossypium darwinii]|uniref:Remorin C-terminal domain-containing protein n=1 Tax=Gossypium darwinii TaxID=34276 RepID=A0A5D2FD31_GOSDA|nr:hypothetical protein ES288_A09G213500v1 [Gossypium darwinii]
MAEEEPKKVETVTPSEQPPPEAPKDVAEEKSVIPPPPSEEKPAESAALQKAAEPTEEKSTESTVDRDTVLARVATEKRISLIKAWEESERSKAENKAHKKLSSIEAWENSKKAALEAELKKIEEKLEKQKAEYVEKMKNKIALIHKEAEEKKAMVEAKRGEDLLKAEEIAAKYRATGTTPNKVLGCFCGSNSSGLGNGIFCIFAFRMSLVWFYVVKHWPLFIILCVYIDIVLYHLEQITY